MYFNKFYPLSLILLFANICFSQTLPTNSSILFTGSGNCEICHAASETNMIEYGTDISPITTWRSSMMGNSSKDPLWRAMVSEEVHVFPELQEIIESRCTNCHAPMGYTEAIFNGEDYYSMSELYQDSLANDGVSCALCHQIQPDNLGSAESWSGGFHIEDVHEMYGPYANPFQGPMINFTGYLPLQGDHVHESELCATCHTLFTPFVDNEGNIAGMFPEQTPYLEWLNSDYPAQGISCQSCHMPESDDAVDISNLPPWHNEMRSPFWKHWFVGSNAYINEMMGSNIQELGLTSSVTHFDSTSSRTRQNLENNTINLSVNEIQSDDTLTLQVSIENLTGHKLPSGIPLRRMWIHLTTWSNDNEVLFESGNWNENGEIIGLDQYYEPHHNIITEEEQVAIYEAVMGDVNDEVTYTLLRASQFLKDNRIPPIGYSDEGPYADTTAVYGNALSDPNFNTSSELQGSGTDVVEYRISNCYRYKVEICFQVLKPDFADHLANVESLEAQNFVSMYAEQGNDPLILSEVEAIVTSIEEHYEKNYIKDYELVNIWPNPFNNATNLYFNLDRGSQTTITAYDINGRKINEISNRYFPEGSHRITWNVNVNSKGNIASGIIWIVLSTQKGSDVKRVLFLK